ncbi:GH92 family glycosyl hydrolase [Dysgonomonas sp. Marseille-P4677]|uniref:GH92 family glycosyl hydrolase n=1 Tax=Dysgonomonas sp. Marseille-P4677 TaxID=2364790 RepID=UPI0019112A6B|nr:GH92 family glycosyl hydrolase [Dysgonomonas sp. Marseille-P4677]MBK5720806.1 GH92 family glycosyl hydrolase [Dysgonomonas sp. Marseille-P4677]
MNFRLNIIKLLTSLLLLTFSISTVASEIKIPRMYVNPNIGTAHSRWFFYTPAALPFGMAKLSPSTNGSYGNHSGWEAVGYEDIHGSIEGFPCLHEFQVGGIMLMPVVGELKTKPGSLDDVNSGFRSGFDKKNEYATAGYYSVILDRYDIKVELTATKRVGFQKYTFPKSSDSYIVFDVGNQLGESGHVRDAYIKVIDDNTIEGYVVTTPEYVKKYQAGADVRMYFYAKVDKAADKVFTFYRGGKLIAADEIRGLGASLALKYNTDSQEQISVKIGLSYTSIENAKKNLESEANTTDFEQAKRNAFNQWDEYLGRINVEGGSEADKTKFYTGLFHALLGRGLASDVNGSYPMNNGQVGQIAMRDGKPIHNHYNTDAIWGAFWNLTQLWSIAYPEYYSDWVQSQLLVYKETGWLGDGIANSKYVSGVGTNFTSLAIAAAYNVGIRDFDVNLGYEAALKNEIESKNRPEGAGKLDVGLFVEKGFAPYSPEIVMNTTTQGSTFGTSHTMEYAFSSYAVSQFAKSLGKKDDYELLQNLSKGWQRLFDSETKLIKPKTVDGKFLEPFDKFAPWIGFQEGNAVQYTFYVPHEIEKLIGLVGQDEFNQRLNEIFEISQKDIFGGGTTLNAFSGLQAVYNHGNQPNLHISWLFNFSGKPYLTQKWVRAICNEFYGTDGIHGYGYGQDEDQGQLGAWYVMAAMGLFDVKGLTEINPRLQLGTPLFDKIEIQLNKDYYSGDKFTIITENNKPENIYIQSTNLNGKKMNTLQMPFASVTKGGVLKMNLSNKPNTKILR